MITVDRGKLKFLRQGRQVEVDVEREYRKARAYMVRLEGSKSTKLRCEVIQIARVDDGCWRLTLRQEVGERPRLLAKRPGPGRDYVSDPHLAMVDEPEAVDARTLERFSAEGYAGHARRKELELRRQHVRSATIRIREAERREDWEAYRKAVQDLQEIERMVA